MTHDLRLQTQAEIRVVFARLRDRYGCSTEQLRRLALDMARRRRAGESVVIADVARDHDLPETLAQQLYDQLIY